MASRLSEISIKEKLDSGHQSLPWIGSDEVANLIQLDLDQLLAMEDAKTYVQSISSQILYHAIKQKGLEQCADILPHLSPDQLIKFMDYDAWDKQELVPTKAYEWLNYFKALGPTGLYTRYRALDEEYQMALLRDCIRIYSEEDMEELPDSYRDNLIPMPCNQVFYEIITDDEKVHDFIVSLVNSSVASDMNYAYSLIAAASYQVPNEAEAQLAQFRKARLEEDGFVDYEESQASFYPVDLDGLVAKWNLASQSKEPTEIQLPAEIQGQVNFMEKAIFYGMSKGNWSVEDGLEFQQKSLLVANSLSAACQVEADDVSGLNRVLEQQKALVSLAVDYLSHGRPDTALLVIKAEHIRDLFRAGLTLVYRLQKGVLNKLAEIGLPEIEHVKRSQEALKSGDVLWTIDTSWVEIVGLQTAEVLKGLFNRFPMRPVKTGADGEHIKFEPISNMAAYSEFVLAINEAIKEIKTIN